MDFFVRINPADLLWLVFPNFRRKSWAFLVTLWFKKKKVLCSIYYSNCKPSSKMGSLPSLSSLCPFSYPNLLFHSLWSLLVGPLGAPLFSKMTQSVSWEIDHPLPWQLKMSRSSQSSLFSLIWHQSTLNVSIPVPMFLKACMTHIKNSWAVLLKYASLTLRTPP